MKLFGRGESERSLDDVVAEIGEEIERRALVQYLERDRMANPRWGLLILTDSSLHVIYGTGQNLVGKLLNQGAPQQRRSSIRLDEIDRIELPPRGSFLRRLVRGPTRTAILDVRERGRIELDVDDDGAEIVEIARARISGSA